MPALSPPLLAALASVLVLQDVFAVKVKGQRLTRRAGGQRSTVNGVVNNFDFGHLAVLYGMAPRSSHDLTYNETVTSAGYTDCKQQCHDSGKIPNTNKWNDSESECFLFVFNHSEPDTNKKCRHLGGYREVPGNYLRPYGNFFAQYHFGDVHFDFDIWNKKVVTENMMRDWSEDTVEEVKRGQWLAGLNDWDWLHAAQRYVYVECTQLSVKLDESNPDAIRINPDVIRVAEASGCETYCRAVTLRTSWQCDLWSFNQDTKFCELYHKADVTKSPNLIRDCSTVVGVVAPSCCMLLSGAATAARLEFGLCDNQTDQAELAELDDIKR